MAATRTVPSRDHVVSRLADLRKIRTPEGIETLEQVEMDDGIPLWVSIRGRHAGNPVLVMTHGGPGSPMMGRSWAYQSPWEDFFTVVNWDQRGVGKNARSEPAETAPMTIDRAVRDAETIVLHVLERLQKERLLLVGFSWGSIIGLRLARRRPELFHAYVGTGQGISKARSEGYVYDRVLALARSSGDSAAVAAIEAIAPYPESNGEYPFDKIIAVRRWVSHFNGGWYGEPDLSLYQWLPEWAPEYDQGNVAAYDDAERLAYDRLRADHRTSDLTELGYTWPIPFVLLQGRHDLYTPYELAREYFDAITAPSKSMTTFERSGHFAMFEEPGRFLKALLDDVRPLSGEDAEYANMGPVG